MSRTSPGGRGSADAGARQMDDEGLAFDFGQDKRRETGYGSAKQTCGGAKPGYSEGQNAADEYGGTGLTFFNPSATEGAGRTRRSTGRRSRRTVSGSATRR